MRVAPEGEVNAKGRFKTLFFWEEVHTEICIMAALVEDIFFKEEILLILLTKGGKQEEIKKPRRAREKQASLLLNFLLQVIWKLSYWINTCYL